MELSGLAKYHAGDGLETGNQVGGDFNVNVHDVRLKL